MCPFVKGGGGGGWGHFFECALLSKAEANELKLIRFFFNVFLCLGGTLTNCNM
jgi:hypothetical protein